MWPLVRTNAELRKFLPSEEYDLGRFSDRYFFWGVLCTVQGDYAEAYIDDAMKQQTQLQLSKRTNIKVIGISDRWRTKLLAHDYASR